MIKLVLGCCKSQILVIIRTLKNELQKQLGKGDLKLGNLSLSPTKQELISLYMKASLSYWRSLNGINMTGCLVVVTSQLNFHLTCSHWACTREQVRWFKIKFSTDEVYITGIWINCAYHDSGQTPSGLHWEDHPPIMKEPGNVCSGLVKILYMRKYARMGCCRTGNCWLPKE